MAGVVELKPVRVDSREYEEIEKRIKRAFVRVVYGPLLAEIDLSAKTLANAFSPLLAAVRSGRITYQGGAFRGKFSAAITKELRAMGAQWVSSQAAFALDPASLPAQLRSAIQASEQYFASRLQAIDERLSKILPEEIAGQINISEIFDFSIYKVEQELNATLKSLTVLPQLTPERRQKIADEWQNNMDLWIKSFAEDEIKNLRKAVQANVYSGNRYDSLVGSIKRSYGVTTSKARFLARQETNLLVTKYKEIRYTEAGVYEYRWGCVAGSKNHPVRPAHKKLEGQIFRWDNPPITTEPGKEVRRNNPGQDFNCRCFAKPIVRF